jgi:serine/threonine-protein kinase
VPGAPPDDRDLALATSPQVTPVTDPGDAAGERRKGPRQVRAGDTLGRYEVGEELGEGGMATVFRARDRELRRDVAVKVLFPHLARRADVVRRFHREARAAAVLEHPNILRIYDVGGSEGDDPPYIVMELVRGRTLQEEIERGGAMLAEIAACIGALLADALAAAHAAGIVHRDVKPANVLIAPGGRLLLGDFGVARLEAEDSLVTRTGALLGTPAYMSPEQAGGEVATTRSDLYSLGATLYQLATGALPYSGTPAKVMSMIALGNLVAPVRRRPACGPDLSRMIEHMMARDPHARPDGATAIAAELRAFAAAGGLGDATEELAAYFDDPERFLCTRTPTVVAAIVTAAGAAVTQDRLPRAMALADRASALAPDDPSVASLIEVVTRGGEASRRNRRLAFGALAVAIAGSAALGWQLVGPRGDAAVGPSEGDVVARVVEQIREIQRQLEEPERAPGVPGPVARDDGGPALDAGVPGAGVPGAGVPDAGVIAERIGSRAVDAGDAVGSRAAPDARRHRADARIAPPRGAAPRDAAPADHSAVAPPIDAAIAAAPVDAAPSQDAGAAPLAPGHVIVRNDVWCNISIDGVDRGNRRGQRLEVTPGHHIVRCVNPDGEWQQEVDITPGKVVTLVGTLLRDVEIKLAVDATIDGRSHARGSVVKRKSGNVEVVVDGKKRFITFRRSCTLTDVPELGCY